MKNKALTYNQLRKHRFVFLALVLALVVIVVGILAELFKSQKTSKIDPELTELAKPLSPTFKYEVFDKISSYTYLSEDELRQEIQRLPIRILDKDSESVITLDQLQQAELPPESDLPAESAVNQALNESVGQAGTESVNGATTETSETAETTPQNSAENSSTDASADTPDTTTTDTTETIEDNSANQ